MGIGWFWRVFVGIFHTHHYHFRNLHYLSALQIILPLPVADRNQSFNHWNNTIYTFYSKNPQFIVQWAPSYNSVCIN